MVSIVLSFNWSICQKNWSLTLKHILEVCKYLISSRYSLDAFLVNYSGFCQHCAECGRTQPWKFSRFLSYLIRPQGELHFCVLLTQWDKKWRNGNFWDEMLSKDTGESYASVQSVYELHENGYLWAYALLLSLQKIIWKSLCCSHMLLLESMDFPQYIFMQFLHPWNESSK